MKPIRVLIVDDSKLICNILKKGLNIHPGIEVVGCAADPFEARDLIVQQKPDVITLDVEMPRMDGITFLKKMMLHMPTPAIVISAHTKKGSKITLDALEAGAFDVIFKPQDAEDGGLDRMMELLIERVHGAANVNSVEQAKLRQSLKRQSEKIALPVCEFKRPHYRLIAIGSSTGGIEALTSILPFLPTNIPGIVIVQHIPAGFSNSLAERLNEKCAITVREAKNYDVVEPGVALIAPGSDQHMEVQAHNGRYKVILSPGEKVTRHRPSADVLFQSVSKHVGKNAVGIILTGMGKDGAKGLLDMRRTGAHTIAQDEKTSIVFGMPKTAIDMGAAKKILAVNHISTEIINYLKEPA